jgi:hypothetical protein
MLQHNNKGFNMPGQDVYRWFGWRYLAGRCLHTYTQHSMEQCQQLQHPSHKISTEVMPVFYFKASCVVTDKNSKAAVMCMYYTQRALKWAIIVIRSLDLCDQQDPIHGDQGVRPNLFEK